MGLSSLGGTSSSSGLGDLFDDIFSSFGTSTGTGGLGGTGTSSGGLGGMSTTSENSYSKYDTPVAKSTASYSTTTTSTPQGMSVSLLSLPVCLSVCLSLSFSPSPSRLYLYSSLLCKLQTSGCLEGFGFDIQCTSKITQL